MVKLGRIFKNFFVCLEKLYCDVRKWLLFLTRPWPTFILKQDARHVWLPLTLDAGHKSRRGRCWLGLCCVPGEPWRPPQRPVLLKDSSGWLFPETP